MTPLDSHLVLLRRIEQGLNDWVATYADDMCKPETVEAAHKRIMDGGGALAYIADMLVEVRKAIVTLSVTESKPEKSHECPMCQTPINEVEDCPKCGYPEEPTS